MDLLQIIKLVSIPKWVKFISLAIIIIFIGLAIYAILGGAYLADGIILQAGMGLLGVLIPLSIVILFLTFYEAGISPLKNATEKILIQLIPEVLCKLTVNTVHHDGKIQLEKIFLPAHTCKYQIIFPDKRELKMELQLNVRKICVVFCFSLDRFIDFSDVENKLEHTLAGARHEGYTTNSVIIHKQAEGTYINSLVLYKNLPSDFLWNSAEKLYFAQDMQVMIQSMVDEAGNWLSKVQKSEQ